MSLKVHIEKRLEGFFLNVQFQSEGTVLGMLGGSGSGKSMTLKCIAGIETPDKGHIEVNGRVLFDSLSGVDVRPQKRKTGYLFQSYALFPNMTVEENIACALSGSRKGKQKQIDAHISRYGLSGLGKRYPMELSGGQKQRAALARILAYEPEVLLLDEPFSALDAHLKETLQVEMAHLLREYRGEVVMVTHDRDEAYRLCGNMMIMHDGQVCAMDSTKAMFERPGHVKAARLTGCKNFSRVRRVDNTRVEALDWGVILETSGSVSQTVTYVGVRAHSFYPAEKASIKNAIPLRVEDRVETPFEWHVLFCNADMSEGGARMTWVYPKDTSFPAPTQPLPKYLAVNPGDVLLLEGSE